MRAIKTFLFILVQYVLPHHLLSRLAGVVAECRLPGFKNTFIERFIAIYGVNMDEAAESNPRAYAHFNDFFTRPLKEGARPLADGAVISPVDGTISQIGKIESGRIFQAKGHHFTVEELLGGDPALAEPFIGGEFTTIYLSPKDYHRVHMPVSGRLKKMVYVPGRLFSVSPLTTSEIPRLFAKNERMVALFETDLGPMALVMVGAMIVASIETPWAGLVTPPKRQLNTTAYGDAIELARGEEAGRFKLGSTAILLFGKDQISWLPELAADSPVRLGELMANTPED